MRFNPEELAIVLEEAKHYSDSKGGYTKPGKHLFSVKLTDGSYEKDNPSVNFVENTAYIVKLDSGTYEAVCKYSGNESAGVHMWLLGNAALIDSDNENTGESFVVMRVNTPTESGLVVIDTGGSISCTVSTPETIVPIDQKYLPGVCLPVVELSTTFTEEASCTEEENAKLKAAWKAETPVVIKCPITIPNASYNSTSFVWNRVYDTSTPDIFIYAYFYGTKLLMFLSTDNGETWKCFTDVVG